MLAAAHPVRKRLRDEAESERTTPSSRFASIAMAARGVRVALLTWLGSR